MVCELCWEDFDSVVFKNGFTYFYMVVDNENNYDNDLNNFVVHCDNDSFDIEDKLIA